MKNRLSLGLLICLSALAQEPKFEISDVHVSTTPQGFAQNFGGVLRAGRYVNRDATMLDLIKAAYGVTEDAISGGPGWLNSEIYEVVGKVPDGTNMATANLMLRSLLEERFKLATHKGTGQVPRYVLSVGPGGSKLKAPSGSGNPGCQPQQQQPQQRGDPRSQPNIIVVCHDLTAADIADNLHQMAGGYFDHDVVDATKLEGTWDFMLEWTGRGALAAKGADGISVFDAVSKQLGLKVELKNLPMESLVIDHVNRKPTDNAKGAAEALAMAPPRFEAASIKPASPDNQMVGLLYTGGSEMRAGGTLHDLIAMALQISPNIAKDTVIGIPKSADTIHWEITAKVPSTGEGAPNVVRGRPQPPPLSVGLQMLYGLMLDRFELKTHKENREVTVYALSVAGGKPKLKQAEESERAGCKPDASLPKPVTNMGPMIACKNTTMTELAQNLALMANAYIDHPIVNATDLEGGWDFAVGWTPKGMLQAAESSNAASGTTAAVEPTGISVFEAVEKELGLKLVKQTRSIPVIVVDHISEKPVE
ncbi:MAG TPA: TIGR03435 family protein [Candidatus Sulfopaludibacter sp.]|jgi:uncharacterized protein (TIGR03435 family)|nr:TIGR03435 family protein [Candidatus Sulfopaludibacter sp.]